MKRTLQMLVMLVSLWACAVCGSGVHIVAPINEHGPQSHLQLQKRKVRDTESMATEITSLNVMSYIASRFANTMVNSKIVNKEMTAREIEFNVQLPDSAFIANFSMELNGTTYVGEVKEKQKAAEAYKKAKKRGHSAGQVSVKPRSTNTFKVSVNVAAGSRLSFTLTYQEMLQRRLGVYEHRISIRPGQIVNRLKIDVYITEPQGLEFIYAPPIVTNVLDSWNIDQSADSPATIDRLSDTRAHVYYYPTRDEQKNQSSEGISGDFVIRYDVSHDLSAGQIQVLNGYFVHYFAPTGLPPVQKNVLFVIDVSGSMDGAKMGQTKEALRVILDDMRSFDRFNILTFSYEVSFWKENMMILATQENILEAKNFVNNLRASGGTNFNGGLVEGVEMLRRVTDDAENTERSAFLVIMLTDGQPTSGETQLTKIQENAKTYIDGQYSLFCLGFGGDVNFKFLQKISLENQGIARRIYEDADGYLQLKGFYDEVATPLLFDVDIQYLGDNVEENSMTQSTFPNYFNGSELVVAGRLVDNDVLQTRITANTADTQLELDAEIDPTVMPSVLVNKHIPEDFIERLWAYLTIKELLKKRVLTVDPEENASLSAKALDLSLKYNFVTPLTSMVVIKPEEPTTNAARGEAEESEDNTANS
uniref:Inter-alpha-trypsin inhibitor heavy chain H3-like n=1 Tax=Saccoglossus kowalevskii TaxID=10224 RepID=A0ABM0M5Z2_SACKO